jgi:DNA-binding NtrC family response regulator
VRVIAATARRLEEMIARGSFREDLYYRLNVVQLAVPPLRERPLDIPLLVDHFFARPARAWEAACARSAPSARAAGAYRWPGNVRELENVIERAVILADGDSITIRELPANVVGRALPDRGEPSTLHSSPRAGRWRPI